MNHNRQVFYHIVSTGFGYTALIFHNKPFSMIRVLLPRDDLRLLEKIVIEEFRGKLGANASVLKMSDSIMEYFHGKPLKVPWKHLVLDRFTALQKAVWIATADIPYGELKSYKEVAIEIGRPRAYRFVGTTLGKNPFPLLIPCHRVIKSDHSIGQFGGGKNLKRRLIELEKSSSSGSTI